MIMWANSVFIFIGNTFTVCLLTVWTFLLINRSWFPVNNTTLRDTSDSSCH